MKDYYNDLKKLLQSLGYDELITKLDQIPNKENSPIEVIKMYNKYKRIAPPNDNINRMKDMNRMQELAGIKTENVDMEDVSDISKPMSEINQDLQDELDRLGIDPSVDGPITITFTNKSGKTKTVTMEKNGSFKMVDENKLTRTAAGIALMCSLVSGMMSCTVDKDVRPNNTQTELPSDTSSENNPRQETPIQGKYAFTGGCNNWNSMYLKITEDSIFVLQKVPEIWASVPDYRVIEGVGFLQHTKSKMSDLTRTGRNTFEFSMVFMENGTPVTALTKFEIDDDSNTGSINTFGKGISGQIKRIYSFN
jgi:hypothetical protein